MDMQSLTLFLKLVREDYKLSDEQLTKIARRMMADESEFSRIWGLYKDKARRPKAGVDEFIAILTELIA